MRIVVITIVFLFVLAPTILSQDILITIDNDFTLVKVLEVSSEQVKYKKYNNLDGPIYIINTSEIHSIEYENGELELYNEKKKLNTQTQEEVQGDYTFEIINDESDIVNFNPLIDDKDCDDDKRQGAFAELGGSGIIGATVNFEYVFINKSNFKFGAKAGLGLSLSTQSDLLLNQPFSAFVLTGSGNSYYEGGLGLLAYDIFHFHFHMYHGYRFQPKCKSYFLRVNLALAYSLLDYYIRITPGVSYGRRF